LQKSTGGFHFFTESLEAAGGKAATAQDEPFAVKRFAFYGQTVPRIPQESRRFCIKTGK